jgi:uncharacterized protein YbjQ (UPF0145 family)
MSTEKLERENATFGERHGLHLEPMSNTLGKSEFQTRVKKVFAAIADKIGKSLGPGGETTFIANYPYVHPTKDGYTIMKNLSFDLFIDDIIKDMADKVCSRLNYSVGDGTTSAIMATNAVYDSVATSLDTYGYKSREITEAFDEIREEVVSAMKQVAIDIRTDDSTELAQRVREIASISSNGNDEIINIVTDLYSTLMYPAITVVLAKDGVTKSRIIRGYEAEVLLTDKMYINNDDNTMNINSGDVIVFDHKVNENTYKSIIKPLNEECKARGRKLVVIAPFYDEVALTGIIRRDILDEYNKGKSVNLVLTACRNMNSNHKNMIADLAMLLNTELITSGREEEIVKSTARDNIQRFFNLDDRAIDGISVAALGLDVETKSPYLYIVPEEDRANHKFIDWTLEEDQKTPTGISRIRVGFARNIELGLGSSIFGDFVYNEDLYNKFLQDAKIDLEETVEKYKKLGSFSTEVVNKQKRLYRLGMKMGIIEVGGESDISQKYLKDAVDDTVRAVESAYNHGIVQGCHVTLVDVLKSIVTGYRKLVNDGEIVSEDAIEHNKLKIMLVSSLITGFTSVYESVLRNADISDDDISSITTESSKQVIAYNIMTKSYDGTVINSCETDIEILRAVIDLVGLIVTANQLVICEGRNGDQ